MLDFEIERVIKAYAPQIEFSRQRKMMQEEFKRREILEKLNKEKNNKK